MGEGEGEGEEARSRDMEGGGDGDQFDVQSNCSHAPTEVYSTDDGDQPRWSSPSLSLPLPASSDIPTDSHDESLPESPGLHKVAGSSSLRWGP